MRFDNGHFDTYRPLTLTSRKNSRMTMNFQKISMTSLIAPSDMTVHSHYNSFRTSMFNASSYASSLSSFSDDDEFKPLYISDDEEAKEVEAKLSRRTSRVKSKGSPNRLELRASQVHCYQDGPQSTAVRGSLLKV